MLNSIFFIVFLHTCQNGGDEPHSQRSLGDSSDGKMAGKANLRHFENRREEGPGDKVEEKTVGRWDEGSLGVGSREQGGTRRGIRYENDGVARRTF